MAVIHRLEFAQRCQSQAQALRQEWGLLPDEFERRWSEAQVLKEDAKNSLRRLAGREQDWLVKCQRLSGLRRWLPGLWPSRMRNSLRASDWLQAVDIACVPVWACWTCGDREYSVQRYCPDAESLWQRAEQGLLQSVDIDVARSLLLALHRAGLAHGDAKLANFLYSGESELKWVDLDSVSMAVPGSSRQARDVARFLIDLHTWQQDAQVAAVIQDYGQQGAHYGRRFQQRVLANYRRFAERHARQYGRGYLLEKLEELRQQFS